MHDAHFNSVHILTYPDESILDTIRSLTIPVSPPTSPRALLFLPKHGTNRTSSPTAPIATSLSNSTPSLWITEIVNFWDVVTYVAKLLTAMWEVPSATWGRSGGYCRKQFSLV